MLLYEAPKSLGTTPESGYLLRGVAVRLFNDAPEEQIKRAAYITIE
jgi:hypothetical protein